MSAQRDKPLDASPKWKGHTQMKTQPTDEDNYNAYHGEDNNDKSLPPPPLPTKCEHTPVIDQANIAAQDEVDTEGRQKSPTNMSTTSYDREGTFAVNPPPSHHTRKTQTPPIPQALSKIDRHILKDSYSKSFPSTAGGCVREDIQSGIVDNVTGILKCSPPMALIPIPDGGSRLFVDSIHLHRPKRGTPDPGTETDASHIHGQKTTIIKPDPTLSRWGPPTNRDTRLIPDRGKNPHENQELIIRSQQRNLDIF